MSAALTFILLLRCWSVSPLPRGPSASFSVVFSRGTLLLVVEEEDRRDEGDSKKTGSGPTVRILSSAPFSQDPESPQKLVCLLTELHTPLQDVLWWVNDTLVTSSQEPVSWTQSERGGSYSATSVLDVSAADWRSRSTYWCGTIQDGEVFRQKVCDTD